MDDERGDDTLAAASRLHMLLASAYGPMPGEKIVLTATRKAVLTSSATTILANTVPATPAEGLVHKAATSLSATAGDGAKSFIIMTEAALLEARKQVDALPAARQSAHRVKLARAACWLVQQVPSLVVPCWHRQALVTKAGDPFSLRTDAHRIVSTALGSHLGVTASAALACSLLDSVFAGHTSGVALLGLARRRTRNEDDGGVVVLAAGGAQPDRSRAIEGRLVPGRPSSELMPLAARQSCGMLLLGEHAASPEVANTFEAKRAGAPATVEAVVRDARGSVPAETCTGFDAGSVACLSDAVRSERAAWIRTLHSAGVRLLLSGAPLGALTSQLCAEYGICAVAGVHNDDLRALCRATGCTALQLWPRSSQLSLLLQPGAGFVVSGCAYESSPIGGKPFVRVSVARAAHLATLVVRAPSESLAGEYAAAVTRALACLRQWLHAGEDDAEADHSASARLSALPGGGAAEMQLEACVRRYAESEQQLRPEERQALEILNAALTAVPRALLQNTTRARALSAQAGRWPSLLQAMREAHKSSATCALGVVFARHGGAVGLQELSDATEAGVLEPLSMKLRLLDSVLCCVAQLLSLDGRNLVSVRRAAPAIHAHRARRVLRPRHRVDGCSSDGTASDSSADDAQGPHRAGDSMNNSFSDDSNDEAFA